MKLQMSEQSESMVAVGLRVASSYVILFDTDGKRLLS